MILSERLLRNIQKTNIEPNMVLEIEGVSFLISSGGVKRYARYGDEGLFYGNTGLIYGGLFDDPNQKTLISLEGTTTQIRQNLNPDKARGTGISQMTIALIDKNKEATKLVGGLYGEILYKKIKVWIGFGESGWKEDYLLVFRGIIESASAEQGLCKLYLSAPHQKQRQLIAPKVEAKLDGAINNTQTTLVLDTTENLILVPDHPAYSPRDESLKSYLKINNEIMRYTGISGTTVTGLTRGALGTTAASHNDEDAVESLYVLEGHAMELALKIMLSDKDQTPYIQNLSCKKTNFNGTGYEENAFFFSDLSFFRDYNVRIGDYVKSSGFVNPANNLTSWTEILDVVDVSAGAYIIVDAPLVTESSLAGSVNFLSKWNSLGAFGVNMDTDEVDIARHLQLKNSFLSNADMRFFVRDEIEDAREWIEKEIYLPLSCYSLPSDRTGLARVSLGIHKAPIPGTNIVTVSKENITNPQSLSVKRSINKYHYNAVAFLFEDSPTDEVLRKRVIVTVGTPTIPTGNKALVINSKGLREILGARQIALDSAERLLERYKSAAETIEGVEIHFGDGVRITVGDIVVFDPTDLNILNREDASRKREPLLMEVVDRSVDIKNGKVKIDLIQTNFDISARFGLISPSSRIVNVLSSTKFVISYLNVPGPFGPAEYREWQALSFPAVMLRRPDWSLTHTTRVMNFSGNTVTIESAPPWTLQEDDVIEFAPYTDALTRDQQKLVYCYLTDDTNPFPDGGDIYVFI